MRKSRAIAICVLALGASLCFSFVVFPRIIESQRINPDPDRFGLLGRNIAQGNGFVYEKGGPAVLERAPFYAYVVAGLCTLAGGYSSAALQIMQAFLHAGTSFLIYLVGLRLYKERTALLAELCFALHPIALWYTARIWVETAHTLLLVALALLLMMMWEMPSMKRAILVGICVALSCLTKSVLLLFPILLIVILHRRFRAYGLKTGAIVLLTMLLVMTPWAVRNYRVAHALLPVNTSLGFNLVQGDIIGEQWPSPGKSIIDYWVMGKQQVDSILFFSHVSWESVEGDRTLVVQALRNYAERPLAFLSRCAANLLTFWYLSESPLKSLVYGILQIALVLLAVLSYVRMTESSKQKCLPFMILLIYYILVNSVIVGWARYSMPIIPLLLILAAPLLDDMFFKRGLT